MSVVVTNDTYNNQEAAEIVKMLTFIEEVQPFNGRMPKPKAISMVYTERCQPQEEVLTDTRSPQYFTYLPFFFSRVYMGHFQERDYPSANISFKGSLRDYQEEVAVEMLQQINTYRTSTLSLYPGFGKTVMGAYLASHLKLKTVIIMNTEVLIPQWEKTFNDNTECVTCIIDINSGKPKKPINFNADVFICMKEQIGKLSSIRASIGFVCFDEAHLLCTPTSVKAWLYFSPRYVLIETATPIRKDGFHRMSVSVGGPHSIIRKRNNPFTVIKIETGITMKKKILDKDGNEEQLNYQQAIGLLVEDNERNYKIVNVIHKMVQLGHKVLAVGKRIRLCELIEEIFNTHLPNVKVDTLCGTKREHEDGDVLIGTVSKMGCGYDQSNFCKVFDGKKFTVLVLMDYVLDDNKFEQVVGRVARCDKPIVIQIYDNYPSFRKVWRQNCVYYDTCESLIRETSYSMFIDRYNERC